MGIYSQNKTGVNHKLTVLSGRERLEWRAFMKSGTTPLNSRQIEAVRYATGPLLVLAGAGSGKTSVITHKIAWLLQQGLKPNEIVAVTFTNKAAREMKQRITQLLAGTSFGGLNISTFHLWGLKFLRGEGRALGYKSGFSIFDSEDSQTLVRELMRKTVSMDNTLAERVHWKISQWKNAMQEPSAVLQQPHTDPVAAAAARVYPDYQRHLLAYNACDFDDLVLQPVRLLQQDAALRARWQQRVRHLLVDEYQDTNATQYALMKLLVGEAGCFTAVGDDDQSVYAWRGAQPQNLQQLQHDFPHLKLVKLEQNYRSMGRILKAANTLIANNSHLFDKKLWSDLGNGDPLRVLATRNEEHEAEQVVAQLLHHKFVHRTAFAQYALLYRSNHQARPFEKALREQHVPYYLSGGLSFFERTEVRDVMAYLRLLSNPDDDAAFLRVVNTPRREIGPATLEKLAQCAQTRGESLFAAALSSDIAATLNARQLTPLRRFADWLAQLSERAIDEQEDAAAVARQLIIDVDYAQWLQEICDDATAADRRLENVRELTAWIERLARQDSETSLAAVVGKLSVIGLLERDDEQGGDQVALMTLHAAKGLEFDHVFIVGMEEELLPHRNSIEANDVEEERRLAYVGITRARKTLSFSYATQRRRYGETRDCEPSRFLTELPRDDLQWQGREQETAEQRQSKGTTHLANLRGLLK